ncbi:MAG: hypothetical protein KDA89_22030, partial [Planctomycetaceae bacterium]|nr:hypothetical protein [Planctomycetaceae bacterium]
MNSIHLSLTAPLILLSALPVSAGLFDVPLANSNAIRQSSASALPFGGPVHWPLRGDASGFFNADSAGSSGQLFRPVSDPATIFRAQSDGSVPVPPGATVAPGTTATPGASAMPGAGITTGPVTTYSLPTTDPFTGGPYTAPQYADPQYGQPSTWNAFSPPVSPDPFVADPMYGQMAPYAPYAPYGANAYSGYGYGSGMPFSVYGTNGPQPYREGWQNRLDLEYIPEQSVAGRPGNFGVFGTDYELMWTGPLMPGWMLQWTNEFRYRNFDGPQGFAGLPASVYRFGWDFEVETPGAGPVSLSLGVTPSINTDLENSPSSTAFQLDGRAVFLFTVDQHWSVVLGANYWDRVKDRTIPVVGVIFRDDFWEWRIMY